MDHSKATGVASIVKYMAVTTCKLAAIVIALAFKLAGIAFTKIGELFEKLSGNGNH